MISPGSQAVIHLHSSVENIQIEDVEAVENAETGKMVKTTFLRANQVGIVKIKVIKKLFSHKMNYVLRSTISCLNLADSHWEIKERQLLMDKYWNSNLLKLWQLSKRLNWRKCRQQKVRLKSLKRVSLKNSQHHSLKRFEKNDQPSPNQHHIKIKTYPLIYDSLI